MEAFLSCKVFFAIASGVFWFDLHCHFKWHNVIAKIALHVTLHFTVIFTVRDDWTICHAWIAKVFFLNLYFCYIWLIEQSLMYVCITKFLYPYFCYTWLTEQCPMYVCMFLHPCFCCNLADWTIRHVYATKVSTSLFSLHFNWLNNL